MSALRRENKWTLKSSERRPLQKPIKAFGYPTLIGLRRAADIALIPLPLILFVGRWLRLIFLAFLEARPLKIRKGPHGPSVEIQEEYRSLHEAQPFTQFLRR